MTARLILTHPNPDLRKKSKDVEDQEFDQVYSWCRDIRDTMVANGGLGLAAPQIGILLKIFAVDARDLENPSEFLQETDDGVLYFINPSISFISDEKMKSFEACLSVPGVQYEVKRSADIRLDYTDRNKKKQSVRIRGKDAVVVQHEYDHLEGKLFIDRLSVFDRKDLNKRLLAPKRQKTEGEINQLRDQRRAKTRAARKKK
jgi:peptide deformylase